MIGFSYKGDIRMRFKMENPKKIDNILDGSYDDLCTLYEPYLTTMLEKEIISEAGGESLKTNLSDETY